MEPRSLETKTLSLAPEAALEPRTRTQNQNPEPEPGSRTQNAELESEPGAQRAARSPPPPRRCGAARQSSVLTRPQQRQPQACSKEEGRARVLPSSVPANCRSAVPRLPNLVTSLPLDWKMKTQHALLSTTMMCPLRSTATPLGPSSRPAPIFVCGGDGIRRAPRARAPRPGPPSP